MTGVIFLPDILVPAEILYRPLLNRLPGVSAVLKDLEIYATGQPPPGYSLDDEIRGIDTAADQAAWDSFTSTGTPGAAPARWHTRLLTQNGCCRLPWTSPARTSPQPG
jgi:hypothetical protein